MCTLRFNRRMGGMMQPNSGNRDNRRRRRTAVMSAAALLVMGGAMPVHSAGGDVAADSPKTATPIKHVIVVIGENRSFDHVYGTYVPQSGDSILNLLSEGIVQSDGSPGLNFAAARQFTTSGQTSYFIGVAKQNKTAYTPYLPAPTLGGTPNKMTVPPFPVPCFQPFLDQLAAIEPSLELDDLCLVTTGATDYTVTRGVPDTRIANSAMLPNGPFQLKGPTLTCDSSTGY